MKTQHISICGIQNQYLGENVAVLNAHIRKETSLISDLSFHLKRMVYEEQIKPKGRRKAIIMIKYKLIKIIADINEVEKNFFSMSKSLKPNADSLRGSIQINFWPD